MTLQNLVGISLEPIEPDWHAIQRLLAAAERNMADAQIPVLSTENRFDAAYKAIMQMAMLALQAHGFRTLTSKPGHHQTAIQSLAHTLQLPADRLWLLDALRKQRHLTDYSGDLVAESAASACLQQARLLHADLAIWIGTHGPGRSQNP